MPIQLIAIDLDGTLLNSQHQLTPRTQRVIQQAVRQGILIVIATGRTRSAPTANRIMSVLGLNAPGIFLQGLMVYNADGSVRHQQTMDTARAEAIIRFGEAHRLHFYGTSGSNLFTHPQSPFMEVLAKYQEPVPQEVDSLLHILAANPINKFVFLEYPEKIEALRALLLPQMLGGESLLRTAPEFLEILPPGVSKGVALARLIEELHIPREQVMALGDAENDIEMLQAAGIGVAMGNAMPHVKAIADFITLTNDEDGVAAAIEKFAL